MPFQNPVLRGFNPDPSLCRVGDDYYMATSSFEWFPGIQLHHSSDLANWTQLPSPLSRASQLDMRGNPDSCGVWAPALSHADGLFWMIYTNVRRYDGNYKDTPNFLVTAPDITGPWSDPVYLNASGFDPSLFHDDDGRKWLVNMVWDHRATMEHRKMPEEFFGGIDLQEYDPVAQRLLGKPKRIFTPTDLGYTEAPHLLKRGGYYYLITAEGGTGYNHAVTHARATTLEGPYELHPDVHVLTAKDAPDSPLQRTGHGQPCDGPEPDTMVHSFLCTRPLPDTGAGRFSPMGRESGIELLEWRADGWLHRRGGGVVPGQTPGFGGTPEPHPTEVVTEFAPGPLPLAFQWLRTPEPDRIFSLSARPGWLRLTGRESIGSWFEQALVARRMTEHRCSAEVLLDMVPEDFQHMAGLVAYYGRHQFHYIHVTCDDDGQRRLNIQSCAGDWPEAALTFPLGEGQRIDDGPIWLGLDIDQGRLQFRMRAEAANDWTAVGPELNSAILSDEGGRGEHANFTGCFLGMAAQDISGRGAVADFAQFTYRATDNVEVGT